MNITSKTKQARKLYEDYQELRRIHFLTFWQEAEMLYKFKQDSLYKYVFGEDLRADKKRSWLKFLAELGVPPSSSNFKLRVYEKWIVELKYKPADFEEISASKLDRAIPFLNSFKPQEILDQAKVLHFTDFIKWLKGNEEPCWHLHKKKKSEEVEFCKDCGQKIKNPH